MNFASVGWWLLVLHLCQHFLELFLRYKQLKVFERTLNVPKDLVDLMPQETFELSRSYGLHKEIFEIVKLVVVDIVIGGLEIYCGMLTGMWFKAQTVVSIAQMNGNNEVLVSLVFILLMFGYAFMKEFPFLVYKTFILEEKYGFNNQTINFFISEQLMTLKLKVLYIGPLLCSIVIAVKFGIMKHPLALWSFCAIFEFVALMFFPIVVMPLFDSFHPLEDEDLKDSLRDLGMRLKVKTDNVSVMEGKIRTSHTDAFIVGFWKYTKIIIYDTLLSKKSDQDLQTSEVLAILVHEIGHWKHYHIYTAFLASQLVFGIFLLVFVKLYRNLCFFANIGLPFGSRPVLIGMMLSKYLICSNINTTFLLNSLSRKMEYDADKFAKKNGYGQQLKMALIKSSMNNLTFPVYDKHYSLVFHLQPTLLQRLDYLKDKDEGLTEYPEIEETPAELKVFG